MRSIGPCDTACRTQQLTNPSQTPNRGSRASPRRRLDPTSGRGRATDNPVGRLFRGSIPSGNTGPACTVHGSRVWPRVCVPLGRVRVASGRTQVQLPVCPNGTAGPGRHHGPAIAVARTHAGHAVESGTQRPPTQSESMVAGDVSMVHSSPLGYRCRPGLALDSERLCPVARQRNGQLADGTAAMGQRRPDAVLGDLHDVLVARHGCDAPLAQAAAGLASLPVPDRRRRSSQHDYRGHTGLSPGSHLQLLPNRELP